MSDKTWYTAVGGQQQGPFSLDELLPRFRSGELDGDTYVFTQGFDNWQPASSRSEFADALAAPGAPASAGSPPPPAAAGDHQQAVDVDDAYNVSPSRGGVADASPGAAGDQPTYAPAGQEAHEIDYEVFGEEMQFVEITLDPQEACVSEAGAFMFMDPGIEMETIFGDGSKQASGGGLMGMLGSAAKRVLTGESLFMTVFGNNGPKRARVAFAAPYPGRIIPIDLKEHGRTILCQKDAFLCAAKGVSVGIALQRKLGAGFFGGEGFILQKLDGDGMTFLHAGGTVVRKTLDPGETLRLDTGCLVALEQTVGYDIQMIKGVKSWVFAGEGIFYAALTGPGDVWIQSLPFSRLASKVIQSAPQAGGKRRGEGSILGGLGDLAMGGD